MVWAGRGLGGGVMWGGGLGHCCACAVLYIYTLTGARMVFEFFAPGKGECSGEAMPNFSLELEASSRGGICRCGRPAHTSSTRARRSFLKRRFGWRALAAAAGTPPRAYIHIGRRSGAYGRAQHATRQRAACSESEARSWSCRGIRMHGAAACDSCADAIFATAQGRYTAVPRSGMDVARRGLKGARGRIPPSGVAPTI